MIFEKNSVHNEINQAKFTPQKVQILNMEFPSLKLNTNVPDVYVRLNQAMMASFKLGKDI